MNSKISERKTKPIEETEEDLCRAMWLSVIVQGMVDVGIKSRSAEALRNRHEVLQWALDNKSSDSDFETVCDLAGISASRVRNIIRQIDRREIENVDFRASKKALIRNRNQENRKQYFLRARKNEQLRHRSNTRLLNKNHRKYSDASTPKHLCRETV